ncbi:MAG: hypothetical protein LBL87_00710 [Ruminococcus sp.]|jgi:hypothetical protein|nr:hypothetical protein [Ruminococcus sp.]
MEKPLEIDEKKVMSEIKNILKKGNEVVIECRKDGIVIIEKKAVKINRQ